MTIEEIVAGDDPGSPTGAGTRTDPTLIVLVAGLEIDGRQTPSIRQGDTLDGSVHALTHGQDLRTQRSILRRLDRPGGDIGQ